MNRFYYSDSIEQFLKIPDDTILGVLTRQNEFALEQTQREAWIYQIEYLRQVLKDYQGIISFEYAIPRMGKRVDVLLIIENVIFVLEFKVGDKAFLGSAVDQVMDYALDLKNFHETSHTHLIAPILIATKADCELLVIATTPQNDNILFPIKSNVAAFPDIIASVLSFANGEAIDTVLWAQGKYSPTPTIIEAAMALYNNHSVIEISRSDAGAINLEVTSNFSSFGLPPLSHLLIDNITRVILASFGIASICHRHIF